MKTIHAIYLLILLAYGALLALNLPPLVRSDHVSVNWNLIGISILGYLIAAVYVIGVVFLKRSMNLSGVHLAILMVETVIILGLSTGYLYKALTFFGVI